MQRCQESRVQSLLDNVHACHAASWAFDRAVLVPSRLAASSPGLAVFYRHQRKRERDRARASRSSRVRLNRLLFIVLVGLVVLLAVGLLVVAIDSR